MQFLIEMQTLLPAQGLGSLGTTQEWDLRWVSPPHLAHLVVRLS